MPVSDARPRRSWKKILLGAIGILVVLFLLIQVVPYGRSSHANPPAANPFTWTDPNAEAIARTSCYDCHSNETKWWWATSIAPFSWVTQRDVDEGRRRLNFSDWNGMPASAIESVVNEGEMAPFQYTLLHPGAKLSAAEKQTLIAGYAAGATASQGGTASGATAAPPSNVTASGDATAIISKDCSTCHAPDVALSFQAADATEAQALIDDMVQRGAQVTPAEEQVLTRYFTR